MTRSAFGRYAASLATALLVLFAVSLVVGQVLGQPLLLGYVETDSMEPTLDPGDGFVAVPQAVAGPVEEGDVVVYRAEKLHGGGLTTHRVVAETDRGYVTKGDANPFTDQAGRNEPPVREPQIVAQALQVGGHVVVVPHLGDAVTGVGSALERVQRTVAIVFDTTAFLGSRGLAYLFFVASLLYYVVSWLRETADRRDDSRSGRDRRRGVSPRLVVGVFAALLVVGATLPMVVPAGTQRYGVVSAEFESERPTVIAAGRSTTLQQPLANGGTLPVVVYLEPEGERVEVDPRRTRLAAGERTNVTVTLHAPDRVGYYRQFVTRHRYLAVLPRPILSALYRVHPWLPIVVIDALVGVPFYLLGLAVVGSGRLRDRSRPRDLSPLARLGRALRTLYR